MSTIKPLILVSNDDGITAPGIHFLVKQMTKLGNVVVVAPNKPQSGMSHAITINAPLRILKSQIFDHFDNVKAYETTGTPADCVKIAKYHILQGQAPDIVVSGINHGDNASINALYSGTLAAALEGAMGKVPSIGFSVCNYSWEIDFRYIESYILEITEKTLRSTFPKGVALNVNFPKEQKETLKGLKVCRQAHAKWIEKFDERIDPYGKKYLWLTGQFIKEDEGKDTDTYALEHNYAALVPLKCDLTDHENRKIIEDIYKK